jgi:hypothetical protein
MDRRKWGSLGLLFGLIVLVPVMARGTSSYSVVATRLMDRKPLCFTGRVAATCRDWESGHAYNVGDQIMPQTGNPGGFTYRARTAGRSDVTVPVWPQVGDQSVQDGPSAAGVEWVVQETIIRHFIRVDFSDPHSDDKRDLSFANVSVTTTPSNKALALTKNGTFEAGFGQNQVATFELSSEAVTPPGDTTVKVCFATYTFTGKTVTNLCGEGKIYNDANIADLVNDSKKALNDAVSSAKTSADKNIFAGLNISVPSGGGETQGSGDLNLNHYFAFPLVGQGIFGLEVKKGSSTNADPRHFTGGIKARKTWLLGASKNDLNALISGIESSSGNVNDSAVLAIANIQKTYFRSVYFDNGLSYEGDISNGNLGNISNVLYNGEVWVNTAVRSLAKQSGFFNFRIMPVGIEAGYNVSANSSAPLTGSSSSTTSNGSGPNGNYSLARLKSGATFTLSSLSPYSTENSARLDLEVSAVNRYLFEKELLYDSKTNSYSSTGTGNKYWAQVALKVLGGSIGSGSVGGRPGLRLAFQRGFLPPVYAFTKVFTISLIYETNDNSSQEINLVNQK